MEYYLAIDIGASSGRHILGSIQNGKLILEEMYRFKNNVELIDGHYCWNIDYLYEQVVAGIQECVKQNKSPVTLGIDTWAVDYVLLDKDGQRIGDAYAYRDNRVDNVIDLLNKKQLYSITGIQFQKFNTIYQLLSDQRKGVTDYLMIPDYLNYLLTGIKVNEYTNMSTTQLLNIQTNQLSDELLNLCHTDKNIFPKMIEPGTSIGYVSTDIVESSIEVIAPATHDTGSAFMATVENDSIIISSGTWSLLGINTKDTYINDKAMKANFTHEGGYNHHYRFLKNIMGLWIIQEVSRNLEGKYSFGKLVDLARKEPFEGIFDVNDQRFLKPDNMIKEIQNYFTERNEAYPKSIGEIAYCVYNSLAYCYKEAIDELEDITGKQYEYINIIGGGCQNELLNELICKVCQKKVIVGPVEATALGNIICQLLNKGVIHDLKEGQQLLKDSFDIKEYEEKNIC